MVRLAIPVVGASSATDRAVASPRLGCAPAAEPAPVRRGCAAVALADAGAADWSEAADRAELANRAGPADRAGAAGTPAAADADQPGRTEAPGRTAGRSCVERWRIEGSWPRPIEGSWLRPADGSPPEPSADGIAANAGTPNNRCPGGWSTATAGGTPRPSTGPAEPAAIDRLGTVTVSWPGSDTERLIGCRKLANPNGRPDADRAADRASGLSERAGSVVAALAGVGSGAACLARAGLGCWGDADAPLEVNPLAARAADEAAGSDEAKDGLASASAALPTSDARLRRTGAVP